MMKLRSTKKLLAGALAAGLLTIQPVTAMAASNAQAGWGAKMGLDYLASQQLESGAMPTVLGGESDWTIIAIEAAGGDAATFKNSGGVSIADYIKTEVPDDATDVARRMLAIAALGKNSKNFGGTDYNELLAGYATGPTATLGDTTFLNDETFAILAIIASGDESLYPLAQSSLALLLANQNADPSSPDYGSFNGGTCGMYCVPNSNDTATAIMAIAAAQSVDELDDDSLDTAKALALDYLLSTQQADGGFIYAPLFGGPADTSSTTWGLMALNAVHATSEAKDARDWLLARQNADGGFDGWMCGASDVSVTVHAVTALLGTTWLLDPAASIEIPDTKPAKTVARFDCDPSTPAETPTEEPSEPLEEVVVPPAPTVTTASTTKTTTPQQPQTLAEETTAEDTTTSQASQENLETAIEDEKAAAKADSSTGKYILYTLIALALITTGWRLLQPKKS